MRRHMRRHEVNLPQAKFFFCSAGQRGMPAMNWIERPAKQTDVHNCFVLLSFEADTTLAQIANFRRDRLQQSATLAHNAPRPRSLFMLLPARIRASRVIGHSA